jgi:hypothetical protein
MRDLGVGLLSGVLITVTLMSQAALVYSGPLVPFLGMAST